MPLDMRYDCHKAVDCTFPRSIRLLGVSGKKTPPNVRIIAGTPASARDIRQPQGCTRITPAGQVQSLFANEHETTGVTKLRNTNNVHCMCADHNWSVLVSGRLRAI